MVEVEPSKEPVVLQARALQHRRQLVAEAVAMASWRIPLCPVAPAEPSKEPVAEGSAEAVLHVPGAVLMQASQRHERLLNSRRPAASIHLEYLPGRPRCHRELMELLLAA
jgi:hypothetical protein